MGLSNGNIAAILRRGSGTVKGYSFCYATPEEIEAHNKKT